MDHHLFKGSPLSCFWGDIPFKIMTYKFSLQIRGRDSSKKKHWKKKRKNIPQKEKQQKKSLPQTCSCIKFTLFFHVWKLHVNVPHWFYFFLFCMAVNNKLLFSTWWFSCRCCWVQVKHRMFSLSLFFKCFVFLKVQSMRWDGESLLSWSGAFMPSEGKFLSFIFLCVGVGNNQNNFWGVQIKLKLILKLTGNGLVMRSHNTVAISPKRVQVMTLNTWVWSISEQWEVGIFWLSRSCCLQCSKGTVEMIPLVLQDPLCW